MPSWRSLRFALAVSVLDSLSISQARSSTLYSLLWLRFGITRLSFVFEEKHRRDTRLLIFIKRTTGWPVVQCDEVLINSYYQPGINRVGVHLDGVSPEDLINWSEMLGPIPRTDVGYKLLISTIGVNIGKI